MLGVVVAMASRAEPSRAEPQRRRSSGAWRACRPSSNRVDGSGGGAANRGAQPQATRRHRCDTAAVAIEGTSSCVHCEAPDALRSAETSLAAIVAACMMVAGLCVTGARNALAVARTTTTLSNDILAIWQYSCGGRQTLSCNTSHGHTRRGYEATSSRAVLRPLRTLLTLLSPTREIERDSL